MPDYRQCAKQLYAASASNVPSPHAKQTGAEAARLHLPLQRLEDSAASAPILCTMDITTERRDVNTPCPRTDISILLQCGFFLLHITAEDAVDLRTLFPVKRIVRLDQPAVVNLDGL